MAERHRAKAELRRGGRRPGPGRRVDEVPGPAQRITPYESIGGVEGEMGLFRWLRSLVRRRSRDRIDCQLVPSEWLRERLSDDDLSALSAGGRDAYEHGLDRESEGWKAVKGQYTWGDEVWTYCSPIETWQSGQGEKGIAIVRQGVEVASVLVYRSSNR